MELTQLRYFKITADCENMTEAAEKLHISQPALSTAVKKLENELNIMLFERIKNKIHLTDKGRIALMYAESIIQKADEMKDTFTKFSQEKNSLSLGFCDPGPMRFSIPSFQKIYSNLNITSELLKTENNLENLLISEQYDAIITLKKPQCPDIVTIPFAKEELMLSVPTTHPLSCKKSICLKDEKNLQIVYYCDDGAYIRYVSTFISKMQTNHSLKIYHDYFIFRQLLENKNLVTFTTKLVSHYRNDGNNRALIPISDAGTKVIYWLSYMKKKRNIIAPLLEWNSQYKFF